jgi:hypothetical protein
LVGNESTASFKLQFDPHTSQVSLLEYHNKPITYEIQENVMMIHARYFSKVGTLYSFQQNKKEIINPAYFGNGHQVFLIDLKKTVPDSLQIGYEKLNFAFKNVIPSGTDYTYYGDGIEVFFPKGSLYDTLYMQLDRYKRNNRTVTLIGDPLVPIKHPIRVTMKADKLDSTGKSAIYHIESNRFEYLSTIYTGEKVTFSAPKLGEFVILTDLVAPTITKISITNRSARLRIRDNLSGIEKIEANIDGKWLLMRYDYKTGIVQSEQLNPKTLLKGMFELKVTDRAGNDRIFKYRIL